MSSLFKFRSKYKSSLNFYKFLQTQAKPQQYNSNLNNDALPVFFKAKNYTDKIALRDTLGSYSYANLFMSAKELSQSLTRELDGKPNERIVFLCPNDANYVITQWAIRMSGQIAVPVSVLHPQNILEYYCDDSNAKLLVTTPEYSELMHRIAKNTNKKLFVLDNKLRQASLHKIPEKQGDMEGGLSYDYYNRSKAMILYTSGTTGKPKGVVLTHKNLQSQVTTLIEAWKWSSNDCILHSLPLHHVHGIVNAMLCPFYIGAKCVMLPKFDANAVWSYLLGVNSTTNERKITVFMAVPTIFNKLITEYERIFSGDPKMVEYIKTTLKNKIRLMVSGSSPLPVPLFEKWLKISGHRLLERYGMTEIGMCLSNIYGTEYQPGFVGVPLPGVSVRLGTRREEDEGDYNVFLDCTNSFGEIKVNINKEVQGDPVGELLVKGNNVFKEYYNRSQATDKEFTLDNWFKTGDICCYSKEKKLFKLLGRKSVDIIKTGGYKVSALEVETHLLGHPLVKDCAVVGVPDETWGERVAAIVVLKPDSILSLDGLKEWSKQYIADYQIPTVLHTIEYLPRNAMGKVNKKELIKDYFKE